MTYWKTYYHLIWTTKYRLPMLDGPAIQIVNKAIHKVAIDEGAYIHAIGMMPDHIHIAVSIPPTIAVSEFVRLAKGSSSYLVNREKEADDVDTFAWQAEYGVLTFGERSLLNVVEYLHNQRNENVLAGYVLARCFSIGDKSIDNDIEV